MHDEIDYEAMTFDEIMAIVDAPGFEDKPLKEKLKATETGVRKMFKIMLDKNLIKPIEEVYDPSKYEDEDED